MARYEWHAWLEAPRNDEAMSDGCTVSSRASGGWLVLLLLSIVLRARQSWRNPKMRVR